MQSNNFEIKKITVLDEKQTSWAPSKTERVLLIPVVSIYENPVEYVKVLC